MLDNQIESKPGSSIAGQIIADDPNPAPSQQDMLGAPTPGETTLAQVPNIPYPLNITLGGSISDPNLLFSGGTLSNPCGYPNYLSGPAGGYYGTYGTYRFMLEHPTIRMARQVVCGPLISSSWHFEHPKELDEDIAKKVQDAFERLRHYMPDMLRALDYGWAPFEVVWEQDSDNESIPTKLKPLLPDSTGVLTDRRGNFVGLRPSFYSAVSIAPLAGIVGSTPPGEKLRPGDLTVKGGKAWVYTHDGEAGNIHGRARLENMRRTAWRDWIDCSQQIQALSGKLSGRQAYAIVPSGGYYIPGPGGVEIFREYRQDALDALTAFVQNKNPVLTSPSLKTAMDGGNIELAARLAAVSPVTFEVVDFGTESPAVAALIERQRHNEELIFNGYLRSARTGLESDHGSRADAEAHTSTGITDSQLLGDDIAFALQPLVDRMCMVNWGLPPGTIKIQQSPIVSSQRETLSQLLPTLLSDPATLQTFIRITNMDQVADALDIPRDGSFEEEIEEVKKEQEQAEKDQTDGDRQHQMDMMDKAGESGANVNINHGGFGQGGGPGDMSVSKGASGGGADADKEGGSNAKAA